MIRVVNVADDISLTVEPSGHLQVDMSIIISCTIRYGGPDEISEEQEPNLELKLNDEHIPSTRMYYQPAVNTDNFQRKTLVSFFYWCRV